MSLFKKTFYIYATSPAELLALKANDPYNPPGLFCSDTPEMSAHGWILLQEHKISTEVSFHDSLILDAVTVVNNAKAKLMADTTDKLRVLDEAVQKLLCLESYTPVPVNKEHILEDVDDAYDDEDGFPF